MLEQRSDAPPSRFEGSLGGLSQQCFEFGEHLLDRIEVRAVGRQEEQLGARASEDAADDFGFVAAEVVDDDDVAGLECRQQKLLDVGAEAVAVDRPIDDARRVDPVAA